ncbi:Piwi domain-containing protein [Pyronema omphalodes]|nr:Piwi domain-containing protein [Pyronema omphalodes]
MITNTDLPKRPGFSTTGVPCSVAVNAYRINQFPSNKIFQYDCNIGAEGDKRALIKKLWNHPKLQTKFGEARKFLIFDGARLAWSLKPLFPGDELMMEIDLDEDIPVERRRSNNKHRILIRLSKSVPMQVLDAYIKKQTSMCTEVIEGLSFLDHLVRETPSKNFVGIKRSFYEQYGCKPLMGAVEAWKGIFQSVRIAQGGKLLMNVDVTTCCFWQDGELPLIAAKLSRKTDIQAFANAIKLQGPKGPIMKNLRRLKKVQFVCHHRSKDKDDKIPQKIYTIEGFEEKNALDTKFALKRKDKFGKEVIEEISVNDYYQRHYNIRLRHPMLPLVRTKKKGEFYPMELCFVLKAQRYPFKLDEAQSSDMIKFTVQRPVDRRNQITTNVTKLNWQKDPILNAYGMKIDETSMLKTSARILPAPKLKFGNCNRPADLFQPQGGKWDLRGRKFAEWGPLFSTATGGLKSWGVMCFGSTHDMPKSVLDTFFRQLTTTITSHGGFVSAKTPCVVYANISMPPASNVHDLYVQTGNKFKTMPQLLFFILKAKAPQPYNDIKSYADTQIGMVTQCLQFAHVARAQPQYCSNVAMKLNAKTGGYTVDLSPECDRLTKGLNAKSKESPTMLLGADVSHASPNNPDGSYASMVGSINLQGTRFAAMTNNNGTRNEMITSANIFKFIVNLLRGFRLSTGTSPKRIIYFRDGVSEPQYKQVLETELECIKQTCKFLDPKYNPQITVVVCSKRHHYRFFPDHIGADKNNNPKPGLIVDKDITHFENHDFYLNSHFALQGTARPVHYEVIWNETKIPVDVLEALIYNSCYTFIRSTTSVSLIPATYYAHIASARARCHDIDTEDFATTYSSDDPRRSRQAAAPPPPAKRQVHSNLAYSMWFI